MRVYFIRDAGLLSVVQAATAGDALRFYSQAHGWKIPESSLQPVRNGVWALFHGELMVFDHDPRVPQPVIPSEES